MELGRIEVRKHTQTTQHVDVSVCAAVVHRFVVR
jgi:hypothetical protein